LPILYLVRHAHSVWSTDEQRPLSPAGLRDAERVAGILKHYPIDAIFCSPSRRAIQTITPLAAAFDLPINSDNRLAERQLSDQPITDFQNAIAQLWHNPHISLPGGESNVAAKARGVAFIKTMLSEFKTNRVIFSHIVVSTHGNLLALILQHFYTDVDYDFWSKLSFPDIYYLPVGEVGTKRCVDEVQRACLYPVRLWM